MILMSIIIILLLAVTSSISMINNHVLNAYWVLVTVLSVWLVLSPLVLTTTL